MGMYDDIYRELLRRLYRELEDIVSQIEKVYREEALEDVFYERTKLYSEGAIEPLISIVDAGENLKIIIELPGAKESTIDVKVYEEKVEITASLDEKFVRETLGDYMWARNIKRFQGTYRLPSRIDVSKIKVEKKGTRIILTAPKL